MLLVLLRGATSISDGQTLAFTIIGGLFIGLVLGTYFYSKYSLKKSLGLSVLLALTICGLIAIWDLAFAIGGIYGAFFGIILSIGIGYLSNNK